MAVEESNLSWIPCGTAMELETLRQRLLQNEQVPIPPYMAGIAIMVCTTPERRDYFSGPSFVAYTNTFITLQLRETLSGVFHRATVTGAELTKHWNRMTGQHYQLVEYDAEKGHLYLAPSRK